MERIGLYGGSFNPVHLGHLLVAQAAKEEVGLDRIAFIPAAISPLKPEIKLAPGSQRLRLLRLALSGFTDYEIDDQEIVRGGVSYTIDTVRHYATRFPQAKLYCLIGADQVQHLSLWREANNLAQAVEFVVVPRPGEAPTSASPPFRARSLRGFPFAVSASQIRDRVRAGLCIDWLVPRAVAEAIRNEHLYL